MPVDVSDYYYPMSRWCELDYGRHTTIHSYGKSAKIVTPEHALRRLNPHVFMPPTPFEAYDRLDKHIYMALANIYPCIDISTGPIFRHDLGYDADDHSTLKQVAITRALANLKDQKVNFAQAFAERGQTARLVTQSATKIVKSIGALRKGNITGAAEALGISKRLFKHGKGTSGSIGDNWLELQYGWKPLLSDVYGSMSELARKDDETKDRYRVTVRGSASNNYSYQHNSAYADQYGARTVQTIQRSVRVRLDYHYTNPVTGTLARLGISDPLTLAWELLPWSFVADWFLPVGSYLQSLSAANGYEFLGGSSTWRGITSAVSVDWGPQGFATKNIYPLRAGSFSGRSVRREVFGSSPLPRFPGLKNPLSLTHMANAISLLSGSVRVR